MEDFSKLDVWALGVILLNMLTLDFAFVNPMDSAEDAKLHSDFVSNPRRYFRKHKVKFRSQQELDEICQLLKGCLVIDPKKRFSISQLQKCGYLKGYSLFVDQATGAPY